MHTVIAKFLFYSLCLWFLLSTDLIYRLICCTSFSRASFILFFKVFYLISSYIWRQTFCKFTFKTSIYSLKSRIVFLSISLFILNLTIFTFATSTPCLYPVVEAHIFHPAQKSRHWVFDNRSQFFSIRRPRSSIGW